jgi:hypothetical protein
LRSAGPKRRAYRGSAAATWTLPRPIAVDRLVLEVASGPDGVIGGGGSQLDGNGDEIQGDDYRLRFAVFPANVSNGAPYVDNDDINWVRGGLNTSLSQRGVGNGSYTIDRDTNGDGRVNVVDVMEVRRRYFSRWPNSEPPLVLAASASAAPGPAGRVRNVTRRLFSAAPVLAGV